MRSSGVSRRCRAVLDGTQMPAHASGSRLSSGINDDNGSPVRQEPLDIRHDCVQRLNRDGLEITGRVLGKYDREVPVRSVQPLLEGETSEIVGGEVKAAVEGIEGELAETVRLATKKGDDGSTRGGQTENPTVNYDIRDASRFTRRVPCPAWPGTRVEVATGWRQADPPASEQIWFQGFELHSLVPQTRVGLTCW